MANKPVEKPKQVDDFIAQAHLVNDKTGREFMPGDIVTSEDFSPETIANWLEIGVLLGRSKHGDWEE